MNLKLLVVFIFILFATTAYGKDIDITGPNEDDGNDDFTPPSVLIPSEYYESEDQPGEGKSGRNKLSSR